MKRVFLSLLRCLIVLGSIPFVIMTSVLMFHEMIGGYFHQELRSVLSTSYFIYLLLVLPTLIIEFKKHLNIVKSAFINRT